MRLVALQTWIPRSTRGALALFERALLPLGILVLGYCGVSFGIGQLYQSLSSRALEHSETGGTGESPSLPSFATAVFGMKSPVARLEIPSIDLDVMVVEGTDERDLGLAVGLIEGTAPLGTDGNSGIAGHRDTHFRDLRSLHRGDKIFVTTPRERLEYRVEDLRVVRPGQVDVLDRSASPRLTLVTCYPFHYIGSAPKRFVVVADLAS